MLPFSNWIWISNIENQLKIKYKLFADWCKASGSEKGCYAKGNHFSFIPMLGDITLSLSSRLRRLVVRTPLPLQLRIVSAAIGRGEIRKLASFPKEFKLSDDFEDFHPLLGKDLSGSDGRTLQKDWPLFTVPTIHSSLTSRRNSTL